MKLLTNILITILYLPFILIIAFLGLIFMIEMWWTGADPFEHDV